MSEKNAVSSTGNGLDPFAQRHFLRNASAPLELRTLYVGLFNTLAGAILVVPQVLSLLLQVASFPAVALATAASIGCLFVSRGLKKPVRLH